MRRAAVLVLALAAALVAAPSADAATLKTDTRCYQASQTQDVVVSGTGYTPVKPVSISRDGEAFGTATADARGAFAVKFPADELGRKDLKKVFTLTATDAAVNSAATRYRTSKVFADFSPHSGDPQKLMIRFTIQGFGLLRQHASVYLHYVAPNGRSRRDVRLGTARGTCGKISKSNCVTCFRSRPSAAAGSCSSTRTRSTRGRPRSRPTSGYASPSRSTRSSGVFGAHMRT